MKGIINKGLLFLIIFLQVTVLFSQVSFNTDTVTGCAPLTVTFTNTSSAGAFYFWDFGDGNTYFGTDTINTYTGGGIYNVELIAFNFFFQVVGSADTTIIMPGVSQFASADSACPSDTLTFSTQDSADIYYWDLGDGTLDTGMSISHNYATSGNYNVVLYSSSVCGNDTISKSIRISDSLQVIADYFAFPTATCPADSVNFINNSTGASSYIWDFGDGDSSDESNPVHIFASEGVYPVTLTAFNSCGSSDTFTDTIFINNNTFTNPDFFMSSSSACPGDTVTFLTFTDAASYLWDFGDGSVDSSGTMATHSYSTGGSYPVSLTLKNVCGFDTTVFDTITVTQSLPSNITVTATPDTACIGDSISFVTSHINFNSTYYWEFGDGVSEPGLFFSTHPYSSPGKYEVALTITNSCGGSGTYTDSVYIGGANPSVSSQGDTLLVASASGAVSWQWLLNGDTLAGETFQNHTPDTSGNYSVRVTDNYGCSATSSSVFIDMTSLSPADITENISIYPNPANKTLYLQIPNADRERIIINMFSTEGKLVQSNSIDDPIMKKNRIKLKLPDQLESGMYFLQIQVADRVRYYKISVLK